MAIVVIAYPKLAKEDFDWIQNFRKKNDELYYEIVKPHFTLVFPVFDGDQGEIEKHVKEISKDLLTFDFVLNKAEENKDAFNDYWHTFLVPEKGYEKIVDMHDKLYTGVLAKELRDDIPFIPHLGAGNSADRSNVERQVLELDKVGLNISGQIDSLDICEYIDKIVTIEKIKLGK